MEAPTPLLMAGGLAAGALAVMAAVLLRRGRIERAEDRRTVAAVEKAAAVARSSTADACGARWLLVIDFECTCIRDSIYYRKTPWLHEIIEFPVVAVDLLELERTGTVDVFSAPYFHRFVRPTEKCVAPASAQKRWTPKTRRPRLTEFCTALTGIEQSTVDAAQTLDVVVREFGEWLEARGLDSAATSGDSCFLLATDGAWDMRKFLLAECKRKHLDLPRRFQRWVDVALHLTKFYAMRRCNLEKKLLNVGLRFQGFVVLSTRRVDTVSTPHLGGRTRAWTTRATSHFAAPAILATLVTGPARLAVKLFRDGCALVVNDGWGEDRVVPQSRSSDERRAAQLQAKKRAAHAATLRLRAPKHVEVDW